MLSPYLPTIQLAALNIATSNLPQGRQVAGLICPCSSFMIQKGCHAVHAGTHIQSFPICLTADIPACLFMVLHHHHYLLLPFEFLMIGLLYQASFRIASVDTQAAEAKVLPLRGTSRVSSSNSRVFTWTVVLRVALLCFC